MPWTFGTVVTPAGTITTNMRELSRRTERSDCEGMFTVGLCPTGSPNGTPATHYISSGWVPQVYAQTLQDPVLLYTRAKRIWEDDGDIFPYTQVQVTNALNQCDVTGQNPFTVMSRLGLQFVRPLI